MRFPSRLTQAAFLFDAAFLAIFRDQAKISNYDLFKIMHAFQFRRTGFTLVEIMIVVVIIGLLAALAVPTFTKIRATSQDKAVTNNLRQILFAADQYFLETGNTQVALDDLVGTDSTTKYIKVLETVANEIYSTSILQSGAITAENVGQQRTITYAN